MTSPRRDQTKSREYSSHLLIWLAVLCACLIFVFHFSFGAGSENLITDSYCYVAVSQGELVRVPYNTRILQPFIASSVSFFTRLSRIGSFELLTPVELLASLLLMVSILRRRRATTRWQAAIVLAFGSSLAVTFGYTPVLVDPLALLLVCLMIAALDRGYVVFALIFACLAALTKEYCVLLGIIWGYSAYRRGYARLAIAAALLPGLALLGSALTLPAEQDSGFHGWQGFLRAMLGYHGSLLKFRGAAAYTEILYMWSWCVLWPIILLGAAVLLFQPLRGRVGEEDRFGFAVMLAAVPFLLLGDWGRAMLVVVPFACAVAASHPLARSNRTALLLGAGGLSTALARPFHGAATPPRVFTLVMIFISTAASALLAFIIIRSGMSHRLAGAFRIQKPIQESPVELQ